ASKRLGVGEAMINWEMFKREFLVKYFSADVRNKKVIEFIEFKQISFSIAEYTVKFESLCRFSPHYNTVEAEEDKCVKFESGLRPDINTVCKKPKTVAGKVFALSGDVAEEMDNLIRDTSANGSVTTKLVCVNCPTVTFPSLEESSSRRVLEGAC
ncbi:hypothetical protein A2U01_0020844, partial [Trifolium medium]|nr:hypothetical protein [Trifolium medium]